MRNVRVADDHSSEPQLHLAGVLVHARPEAACAVRRFIASLPGACIHNTAADPRLVVTLEAQSAGAVMDQLTLVQGAPGVLSALLVYQHNEPLSEIDQEVMHGD